MQNLFNSKDYQSVLIRINKISALSENNWGKMNVNQMVLHVKDQLDIALGHKSAAPQGPFHYRTKLCLWLKLYILPWKKNKEITPREMDSRFNGMVVTDFENDKHLLLLRLQEFVSTSRFNDHPFYGKLTKKDWGRLAWKHINHHLMQFGE